MSTMVLSLFSALLAAYVLLSWALLPGRREHPGDIVMHFSAALLLWLATEGFLAGNPKRVQCADEVTMATNRNNIYCGINGAMIVFFSYAAVMWAAYMVFNVHLTIVWRSDFLRRYKSIGVILCWGFPAIATAVTFAVTVVDASMAVDCFISPDRANALYYGVQGVFTAPSFFATIGTVAYIVIMANKSWGSGVGGVVGGGGGGGGSMDAGASVDGSGSGADTFRPIRTRRQFAQVVRTNWRALAFGLVFVVTYLTNVIFFNLFVIPLAKTDPGAVWIQTWKLCIIQTYASTNGSATATQDACASAIASNLPPLSALLTAAVTISTIGVWAFLIFGMNLQVLRDWREACCGGGLLRRVSSKRAQLAQQRLQQQQQQQPPPPLPRGRRAGSGSGGGAVDYAGGASSSARDSRSDSAASVVAYAVAPGVAALRAGHYGGGGSAGSYSSSGYSGGSSSGGGGGVGGGYPDASKGGDLAAAWTTYRFGATTPLSEGGGSGGRMRGSSFGSESGTGGAAAGGLIATRRPSGGELAAAGYVAERWGGGGSFPGAGVGGGEVLGSRHAEGGGGSAAWASSLPRAGGVAAWASASGSVSSGSRPPSMHAPPTGARGGSHRANGSGGWDAGGDLAGAWPASASSPPRRAGYLDYEQAAAAGAQPQSYPPSPQLLAHSWQSPLQYQTGMVEPQQQQQQQAYSQQFVLPYARDPSSQPYRNAYGHRP
ncbi:hypothetical protein DFJ73DRAFT_956360 [Zopfochytrium polystomum]|nr:hypothetical protein DFJ73DRAFT_956360 [Zopfochytrium polystomum]